MSATYDTYRWSPSGYTGPSPLRKRKLTTAQRMEIGYRRMEGEKPMDLALEYGVSRTTIDGCAKMERPYGI